MPEPIQTITRALLEATVERARQSPRLRTNYNFHADDAANPHRFLNAFIRGTYVTPHRHATPPKSEAFLVLTGRLALLVFDDQGEITGSYHMGEGDLLGMDIAPGIWHSLVALSDSSVTYEVKPGPYTAMTDKEFAPFAPREGDPHAPSYLARLVARAQAAE
jgi:cupin fold WbuC family metalloprotein